MKKKPKSKLTAAQKRAALAFAEVVVDMVRTVGDPKIPDALVHDPDYLLALAKRLKVAAKQVSAVSPLKSRAARKTFDRRWVNMPEMLALIVAMKLQKKKSKKAQEAPPVPPTATSFDN